MGQCRKKKKKQKIVVKNRTQPDDIESIKAQKYSLHTYNRKYKLLLLLSAHEYDTNTISMHKHKDLGSF